MDSNQRLVLTVILSVAILLGFQFLYPSLVGAPEGPAPQAQQEPAEAREQAPTEPAAPSAPTPLPADEPETFATLRTEAMELTFSSRGAGLVRAELQGEKGRRQGEDGEPIDLAAGLQEADVRLFQTALGGNLGSLAGCTETESTDRSVAYRCSGSQVELDKRFSLTGDQTLALEVTVRNVGTSPVEGSVDLLFPARVDPSGQQTPGCGSLLSAPPQPVQVICRHGDDVTRRMYDASEPTFSPAGLASFAGIEERYFLAVAAPVNQPQGASCVLETPRPDFYLSHLVSPTGNLAAGTSVTLQYALVLGQKDIDVLEAASRAVVEGGGVDPALDETVDLGFWAAIGRILFAVMRVFHAIVPNWGVAIILLTVFVKVLTFPLAWKSMKAMESMRALAPEIEKLKEKYGEDREKLNLEMMKLYQQHKVNPLGGCLPMLIQMPIWLALYTVLQTSVVLYNEPFIGGWIDDLTSKDPYYALPLAMGLTMFITQKMQPVQMDAAQQKTLLYFMPIFFTFIMLNLPAGLTLYIFTNNLLSIGQQLAIRKTMGKPGTMPAAAATISVDKRGKKKGR